jgi:hypothetical protein
MISIYSIGQLKFVHHKRMRMVLNTGGKLREKEFYTGKFISC